MPFFEAIEPPRQLPAIGSAVERAVMDFKDYRAHRAWKQFEYAKDIAAFANLVGGTLVIGAREDGHLREYVGLTDDEASTVRQAFSEAVADRCMPRPVFDFASRYSHPDDATKQIVVINVPPSVTPIGVKVTGNKADGYGGPCWVYPVRSGTDARYLDPSQLAMLMSPTVRRHAVMLSKIPRGTRVYVRVIVAATGDYKHDHEWLFEELDEQNNVVKFASDNRLPLDRILSVHQLGNGGWRSLATFSLERLISLVVRGRWAVPQPRRPVAVVELVCERIFATVWSPLEIAMPSRSAGARSKSRNPCPTTDSRCD